MELQIYMGEQKSGSILKFESGCPLGGEKGGLVLRKMTEAREIYVALGRYLL